MIKQQNIFKIVSEIKRKSKTAESYDTGLFGEQLIVSAYETMTIEKLVKLRYIMNKIIKKKKEYKRYGNKTTKNRLQN